MAEKLKLAYKSSLLQIAHNLEAFQEEELRFYYDGIIMKSMKGDNGTLNIFRSLENAGKITWEDVRFLKEGLLEVRRLDLAKTLMAFETKRDLTILLDFYAKRRHGLESSSHFHASESVAKIAECLVILITEINNDRFDVSDIVKKLLESRKAFKKVLVDFEEEIERELSDSWSKLTLLVVIAGEIIAVADEERRGKLNAMEMCFTVADELCFRMLKLGSWVS